MTPEQQFMWDHLSDNYAKLTHDMANDLVNTHKRWVNRKADKFLLTVNTWPIENSIRALVTWLNIYKLPLDPRKLSNFDTFHDRCGKWIINNKQPIRPF